jgi:hypothetical protein
VAGRPLRPATDCRLGRPLPHQLANPTLAHPIARGLTSPRFPFTDVCGISQSFDWLFPTTGKIPKHYSPVRRSSACIATPVTARLACVRHAASVQSEPGSNSSVNNTFSLKQSRSQTLKVHRCPERKIRGTNEHWSFGTRIIELHQRRIDASPCTSYLFKFLKNNPGRQRPRANFQV